MKKILITTCAILMVSTVANACGGITVKGNSGATYCLSKQAMNWYSAYAWCHDQGMSLIDIESVCKNYNSCPELTLSSEQKKHITDNGGIFYVVWTNTPSKVTNAFHISLTDGSIDGNRHASSSYSNPSTYGCALCF